MQVLADELDVMLLHPHAQPPTRTRPGDAGYDLCCAERFVLAPGTRNVIPTGVALAIPSGWAGLVLPRSGLAARYGVTIVNAPGLIDPNYRGEIKISLQNTGEQRYVADAGDRIAQLLLVPFATPTMVVRDELPPSPDDRGTNGFGSSGR